MRFLLLVFVLIGLNSQAQHWSNMMNNPEYTNVYEIKEAFDAHFGEDYTYQRGQGWKQFNRWFYFMEQRCYPSGEFFDPSMAWTERMKFLEKQDRVALTANWTPMGPDEWTTNSYNPGLGRVNVIVEDPNDPNTIYIGVPSGGCWKSTDGGNSWTNLTDHLPVLGVSGIAVHPNDPNTVFIGTGDGDGSDTYSIGVLKSTDGGQTWSPTGLNWSTTQFRTVRKLVIHPTRPDTMYAATSAGFYHSHDGGVNWTQTRVGSFRDLELHPTNPDIVYACTDQFYRSTDGGVSMSFISSGLPGGSFVNRMAIAVSPDMPNRVYGVFGDQSDATFYGLYRSDDDGLTWSLMANSPNIFGYASDGSDGSGQSWYDLAIAANPLDGDQVFVGGVNVWKSDDGGSNFNIMAHWVYPSSIGYVHADIHELNFINNRLYCGSDGGIFKSTDEGDNWTDLSEGLQIMQFYRISTSTSHPNRVSGGAQDNGTNVRGDNPGNLTWNHIRGADGMETIIHPTNPNIIYTAAQYGSLRKSTDGGFSTVGIDSDITEDGAWVTPYVMYPNDPDIIYAGYDNLWATFNGGNSWVKQTNSLGLAGKVRSLALAPSNPDYIYVASLNTMKVSMDAGSSFLNITPGLPNASISYIAVDENDPNKVWVSFSGYNASGKVYYSSNAGSSWQNLSGGLPNLPVNCVIQEPNQPGGLYVGTDVGIYYRDNDLGTWVDYSTGLPNVIVQELEITKGTNKLRAGTYGRGLWESDRYQSPNASLEEEIQFQILPNPAKDRVEIQRNGMGEVRVYTIDGKEMYRAVQKGVSLSISVGNWPRGTYIIQIQEGNLTSSQELILD